MLRKTAGDRHRGLDAIIGRSTDPKMVAEMKAKKATIDSELAKELKDLEDEYRKRENQIAREVQSKTMDREADQQALLQERQIEEKREIFTKFLPDSMMEEINDQMAGLEREELKKYKAEQE